MSLLLPVVPFAEALASLTAAAGVASDGDEPPLSVRALAVRTFRFALVAVAEATFVALSLLLLAATPLVSFAGFVAAFFLDGAITSDRSVMIVFALLLCASTIAIMVFFVVVGLISSVRAVVNSSIH